MINTTITHIIAAFVIVLLFTFSSYLFLNGKRKMRHQLLGVFFIANAFYLIDYLLIPIQKVFNSSLQRFDDIGLSFAFLFGPTIFFFIHSIIKPNFSIQKSMLWHFLPFAFFFTAYSIGNNMFCQHGYMFLYVHLFVYYIASLLLIRKYISQIKSFFSVFEEYKITWIIYVLIAFILVTLIDATSAILAFFHLDNTTTRANLNFASVALNFAYVVYIFYKSIQIPQYPKLHNNDLNVPKYSKSKLTDEHKFDIRKKIEEFYSTEKPYLNPSLTISEVSDAIDVPMKNISQVINELLNKNFYDFTNSFRITEAKVHLENSEHNKETILEILYKSGFNSKSSFNTAFKKHSGLTPTQYKKMVFQTKNA